jgi:hypothetical protein
MRIAVCKTGQRLGGSLIACGLFAIAGCGGLRVVPVAGKATADGQPLTRGVVSFNPDPAKGNTARVACRGRVQGDGRYELYTDDGSRVTKGAPVGWYKVTFASTPGDDRPLPVSSKYTDFDKTDVAIEVSADPRPGAYDLVFSK